MTLAEATRRLIVYITDYPAYELYTETLRKGIFDKKDKQMRLIIGRHRRVSIVEVI